jgi:4-amino-4-deoxy-L-arabinose transferase-like glycosyltransferase
MDLCSRFSFHGVSPLTIRLPAILLAALTLLIFYRAMRDSVGHDWAAIAVWIMAVDPANVFPSRLDWGCTVLMLVPSSYPCSLV